MNKDNAPVARPLTEEEKLRLLKDKASQAEVKARLQDILARRFNALKKLSAK